jgi:hypothetical protein
MLWVDVSGTDPDWAIRVGGGVRIVGEGAFDV